MKSHFVAALVLLASLGKAAHAGLSKEQFFLEYEPAAKKLQEFYGAMTMSGLQTRTEINPDNSTKPPVREGFALYANGDRLRVDIFTPASEGADPFNGSVKALVAGTTESIRVTRDAGAKAFVLRSLGESDIAQRALRVQHYDFFAPYATRNRVTWLERLRFPILTILDIEEEQRDGESLVTVTYHETLKLRNKVPTPPLELRGSVTFCKSKGWVVLSSASGPAESKEPDFFARVEYGDSVRGIPLLKKYENWTFIKGQRVDLVDCDINEISPVAAPERDFTLAAFGIGNIRAEKETNYWLYLIVLGVTLIAAAIVIGRLAARKRARV